MKISYESRVNLLKLVLQDGKTLAQAGRDTGIKPSTVRAIVANYQEYNTVFETKEEKQKRKMERKVVESEEREE